MTTRRRSRFVPALGDALEARIVAARGVGITPVAVAPLDQSARMRGLQAIATDQVNAAFDDFTRDYLEAQNAYLSAPAAQGVAAKQFYRSFIRERTGLLAEQLTRVFTQLPNSLKRLPKSNPNGSFVLQSFLRSRITGPSPQTLLTSLAGPAGPADTPLIPNIGALSGSAATLYKAQSLTAIDTARAATLNATTYLINGTFKNGR